MDLGLDRQGRARHRLESRHRARHRDRLVEEGADVVFCARGEEALAEAVVGGERPRSRARGRRRRDDCGGRGRAPSPLPSQRSAGSTSSSTTSAAPAPGRSTRWTPPTSTTCSAGTSSRRSRSHGRRCRTCARAGGVIAMVASIWGREAGGGPGYNIAKAAEISLAKAMAGDLAKDGIRVFSVAPGSTLFPGGSWERRVREDPEGMAAFVERELPWGRLRHGRRDRRRRHVPRLAAGLVGRRHLRHRRRRPVALVLSRRRPASRRDAEPASTLSREMEVAGRIADSFAERIRALEDVTLRAARRPLVRDARPRARGGAVHASGRRSSATATGSSTRSRSAG